MNILLIAAVLGVLFFGFQLLMVRRMKRNKGKAAPELSGNRGEAVQSGALALFYFHSPSCGACRTMTPVVQRFTGGKSRCFSVDVSRDMDTARAFGVMATPTTVLVEGGIIRDFLVGPQPESRLLPLLEQAGPAL